MTWNDQFTVISKIKLNVTLCPTKNQAEHNATIKDEMCDAT